MKKFCPFCEKPFHNEEDVTVVYDGYFKEIASRVTFAVSKPAEIKEIFHPECYEYVRGGGI